MKKFERYVGIDLGTTNTTVSIAYVSPTGKLQAETLDIRQIDEFGSFIEEKLLPSVLYIDEGSVPYVGRYAKKMLRMEPETTASLVKRYIGKEDKYRWKMANGKQMDATTVSSFYLKAAKNAVEKRFLNQSIEGAVITTPANFDFQQQAATKAAAVLAGFDKDKIVMIPEPTAALIDFLEQEKAVAQEHATLDLTSGPKTILVFDLGGGTCDVTVHRVSANERGGFDIAELSISQYTELGGKDFDDLIMKKLTEKWMQKLVAEKNMSKQDLRGLSQEVRLQIKESLLAMAEEAKVQIANKVNMTVQMQLGQTKSYLELSKEQKAAFNTFSFTQLMSNIPEEYRVNLQITKEELDEAIRPLLYSAHAKDEQKCIEYPLRKALSDARVPITASDVDYIFLVGGMTYYPAVQERVYELFNERIVPLMPVNSMYSVSRGASIYHYNKRKITISQFEESDFGVTNTMPQNVYIDVAEGEPVTLIQKGTEAPFSKMFAGKFFVTGPDYSDYVTNMELQLYTAEDSKSMQQHILKNAVLEFSKPVKVGTPLTLHVQIDEERNVSVTAWLQDDETQRAQVNVGIHEYSGEEKEAISKMQESLA
jgi:molecular chaperone DnaK